MARWGSPREYSAYYGLLLTRSGRLEFLGWLERENKPLYEQTQRELMRGDGKKNRKVL